MQFDDCPDVRLATPQDANGIYDLLMMAHAEQGEHPVSPQKVCHVIINGIERNHSLIGVIGEEGNPLGCLIMQISSVWYSDENQLMELINFVHPDHRRSTYAKQLIRFSKHCAQGLHLDLTIGVFSSIRTAAKVRLYARELEKKGEFFVLNFKSEPAAAKAN